MRFTIVQVGRFYEEFEPDQPSMEESGELCHHLEKTEKVPFVAMEDMAQCVAAIFCAGPAKMSTKTIKVVGEMLTPEVIAATLRETLNCPGIKAKSPGMRAKRSGEFKFWKAVALTPAMDLRPKNAAAAIPFKDWISHKFPKAWKPAKTTNGVIGKLRKLSGRE